MTTTIKRKASTQTGAKHTQPPTKQPRLDAFFAPRRRGTQPDEARSGPPALGQLDAATNRAASNNDVTSSSVSSLVTGRKVLAGQNYARDAALDPSLSHEQRAVLEMVVDEGRCVFFTGSAGTGKSLLLRAIVCALRNKYARRPECLAVCASTGIAAQNIGGTTIHAWGAVTPGMHDIGKLISFIKTCRPAHRRWKAVRVLVIDEVSMVDGQLLDTLAALAKELRKSSQPFGGIQLVVTGDFFQLPPVTPAGKEVCFAFQSSAWKECIERTITLTQVFRQKDSDFITLLNAMRRGEIHPTAANTLKSLSRPLSQADGQLQPTELFPLRAEVDRANAARMAHLAGPVFRFTARDAGQAAPEKRRRLLDSMTAVAVLEVKRDAQVMLVKNVSETLVNGTVGRVVGFCGDPAATSQGKKKNYSNNDDDRSGDQELLPLVEFETFKGRETLLVGREEFRTENADGNLLARRVQIPLVLAWAMSIHKAQGQTIQRVKVDLNKVFEKGQSYVALSRAATLSGLQVLGFDARKVVAHPRVIEWSKAQSTAESTF